MTAPEQQLHATRTLYARLKPPHHPVSLSPQLLLIAAAVYGALFFGASGVFLPGGAPFATLLLWLTAVACADIAAWARLPRVVGMLLGGLLLANVPNSPVAAFPSVWGSQMRAAGLATIYLRCGCVLEWGTISEYKVPAIKLAVIPGLAEMGFDAGIAVAVFGMPILLALTLGSLLQAVGPALLVPLLFGFQQQRLGTHEGAPQAAIVSASFDDIIAITWFSVFSCLAITGESNVGWQIASGPLQIIFGIAAGAVFGTALGVTRLWDTERKRAVATYVSCLLIMFFLVSYNMLSGGALGSLVTGMTAAVCWRNGWPSFGGRAKGGSGGGGGSSGGGGGEHERCAPPRLTLGPAPRFADEVEAAITHVWDWIAEPMIFVTIGASIDFSVLPRGVISRAVLIVCTGLVVRMATTFLVMRLRIPGLASDYHYSTRTAAFFAVAWVPKATVQAALSGVPLRLIKLLKHGSPNYDQWLTWGHEVQATGVICVLICATLGTLATQLLGPRLLDKAPSAEEEKQMLAEAAAQEEEAMLSEPGRALVAPLPALLHRYMELTADLRARINLEGRGASLKDSKESKDPAAAPFGAGPRAAKAPVAAAAAAAAAAARAPGGDAAELGEAGPGARRRAASSPGGVERGLREIAGGLERLEELLRQRLGAEALTVRRALELESALRTPSARF